jgi:Family of unknown function (DUF5906)
MTLQKEGHLRGEQVAKRFLEVIFQTQRGNQSASAQKDLVWLASVTGELGSGQETGWHGGSIDDILPLMSDAANNYYCVGVLKPGSKSRAASNVTAVRAVVLDDIGSKIVGQEDTIHAIMGCEPTFIVQTSTTSQQWVFVPKAPITDLDMFDNVMAALASLNLLDTSVRDRGRYVRLPWGKNTKKAYMPEGYDVHLAGHSSDRLDFDALAANLEPLFGSGGFTAAGPGALLSGTADLSKPDATLRSLSALGLVKGMLKDGVVDITCPFVHEHTGQADTGSGYLGDGAFKCWHSHCEHRTPEEWRARVCEMLAEDGKSAAGLAFDGALIDGDVIESLSAVVEQAVVPDWVQRMNERFALCQTIKGVLRFPVNEGDSTDTAMFDVIDEHTFRTFWDGKQKISVRNPNWKPGGDPTKEYILKGIGSLWIGHEHARRYTDIGMWDGSGPAGVLNLYDGLAVEPDPTKPWPETEAFVRDVICGGDTGLNEWVLNWVAAKVQSPLARAETALALVSPQQGTGKGTFAKMLIDLFGPRHSMRATKKEHLFGRFNSRLEGALLVFSDEAMFGRDPGIKGEFKALITEPTITVEAKFQKPREVRNTMAMLIASNELAAVPLDPGDRRATVVEVSDKYAQDRVYFGRLRDAWENGGEREGFLASMLARDVRVGPDPKQPYATAAKGSMAVEASNDPVTGWWADVLEEGRFPVAVAKNADDWETMEVEVTTKMLHEQFQRDAKTGGYGGRGLPGLTGFGRTLSRLCPGKTTKNARAGGSFTTLQVFPKLGDARAQFDKIMRGR